VPPVYEWDLGPPVFDFREQVPTAITSWLDYYWDLGVDANRLTSSSPDTVEIAGFTVAPTAGEAAVVMGNEGRTLIDGFLWDDQYQDADGDGLQDATELVMNQILLILCVPLPDFSASVTSGNAPLAVDFTDETNAAVESWYWDFGDGGTSTEQDPSHTYLAEGLYTVSLTAANANGWDMARKVDYIAVGPPEPTVAAFSATPTSGNAPLNVTFTDESTGALLSAWAWDFGDSGTSTAQNPTHQYAAAGTYTVSLTVTGLAGPDTETKVDYIGVGAPPPTVADFSATPTGGNVPLNVSFTDESTGTLLSAWAWDFGDGGTSTQQSPAHQYTTAGTYTVSLTVTGFAGPDTETKTDYITVETAAGANFSATPIEGVAPLEVAFTDLTTGDVVAWDWDFGDGGTSTVQDPSHEYTEPGRYTVSLVASDSYGSDTETKTRYIAVGFPDTPPDTFWAFDEVLDCVDAGVVAGYEDGLYHPDIQIDRAQMATYTARALAGGDSGVPEGPPTPTFPDVESIFWAYDYIEYAVDQNVVQGYDDGYYHPEIVLDRGQMAVFVARAVAGDDGSVPAGPVTPTFPDVATDFWSYKHVEYCVDQGIVGGYDDGLYHPERPVTRDQMAVYVARALPLL
jgi:PKD repeat protein